MSANNKNNVQLFPHQTKCVDWLKNHYGLVLYHSMGSGKTITSLSMVYQFKYPIVIISTKASRKNFTDDIKKMQLDASRFQILTYQKAIKMIMDLNLSFSNCSVIIDEAHHLRSGTKLQSILIEECTRAKKIVLLTGTIFYNSLTDLSVLVNIIKKDEVLPETNKEFKFFFWDDIYEAPGSVDTLEERIKGTISYYKKSHDSHHYPKSTTSYVTVDMSNAQISEYRHYLKKILSLDNIQHIDYSVLDKRKVNNFLNVTRQLSNTLENSPDFPKILAMWEYIKKNPKPIVVYSNYLSNGILPLTIHLNKNKVSYALYYGEQVEEKRNKIINNYNDRKIDVLLITSAGSESLDLKNTRSIHIMEPHWNESKINQIIGRAIRYDSHKALDVDSRTVEIVRWISVFGYKIPYETADEYLVKKAKEKDKMFEAFDKIIQKCSI
jgi:superfamily II DNA or RNA helicase